MLHMEVIQERLEREYDLDLITTAPTVVYEVEKTNGEVLYVDSPAKLPAVNDLEAIREPMARCNILVPSDYLVMLLPFVSRSAVFRWIWFITETKLLLPTTCLWQRWY